MASSINASLTAGIVQTADTSGNLNLQSGGTTIAAITSTGVAVTGTLSSTSGALNGSLGATTPCLINTGSETVVNLTARLDTQAEQIKALQGVI